MTTLAQVVSKIVTDSIDWEYVKDCGHTTIGETYQAEYGYNGTSAKACKDYLQGLPSACTIPFWNDEILAILEKSGIVRKKETARDALIENYWLTAGAVLNKLIMQGK